MMKLSRRTVVKASAASLAMAYFAPGAQAQEVAHVFNWTDYIGKTTLSDFQQATGIRVVYDTYDSTESAEAKLLAGKTGYDVVLQAGVTLPRFVEAGIFQKLDKAKLPNWKHLDETILKVVEGWDPGNKYGVPYMWGTAGITVNLDMVQERVPAAPLDSLDILFKPEVAAKLADCGISVLESPSDVFPMVLAYLGKDPNTTNPDDFDAVVAAFKPIRQYIKTFDASHYLNALPNRELCVVNSWSGDYATAKARAEEAGVRLNLQYFVPKSGSPTWFDLWTIPADAPHVDNAHKFINYLMEPEVIAKCTNFTHYANVNKAANAFVDKAVLEDPAIYPSDDIKKRLWTQKTLPQKLERARTRAWSKIKTGS